MKVNKKKLKKSISIGLGLLVAFFAQQWFEQAYEQPSDIGKLIMIFISLVVITIILYTNLDKDGNF